MCQDSLGHIDSEAIRNPSKNNGIDVETIGSEDAHNHRVKPREMSVSSAAEVSAEMAKLVTGTDKHTIDVDDDTVLCDVKKMNLL